MQKGLLIGIHDVVQTNKFLGIQVVVTRFGLHLIGKNETILASILSRQYWSLDMGPLDALASKLIEDFVDRQYNAFDYVYSTNNIAKGA